MASRFRGEVTIVPPVRIELRENRIATTIDWSARGADRALSDVSLRIVGTASKSGPLAIEGYLIPGTRVDFGGGSVAAMTSLGLSDFKQLLQATQAREREIRTDIRKARLQHAVSWTTRALTWSTLIPLASRRVREKSNQAVTVRKAEVAILRDNLVSSRISISFDMGTAVADPHCRMLAAFSQLTDSNGSWALQIAQQIDRVRARSMSNVVVARRDAKLALRADPLVDTADTPPSFPVQNGRATAYFYPGFVLVVDAARSDFALIDLNQLNVRHQLIRFTETGKTPADAQMIDKVWAKSNKNGSRDRRFKDNRELPVMLYGELSLEAAGGLHEAFHFSRNDASEAFALAVQDLKRLLSGQTKVAPTVGTRKLPK